MKPFNLQDALEGESVASSCGMKVLDIAYLPNKKALKVVAVFEDGVARFFDDEGMGYRNNLYMAPKVGYVNIWRGYEVFHTTFSPYKTREEAVEAAKKYPGNSYVAVGVDVIL